MNRRLSHRAGKPVSPRVDVQRCGGMMTRRIASSVQIKRNPDNRQQYVDLPATTGSFCNLLGAESTYCSWEFYHSRADSERLLAQLREQRTLSSHEFCFRHKDGSPVHVLANVSLETEEGEAVIHGTIVDITEPQERGTAYGVATRGGTPSGRVRRARRCRPPESSKPSATNSAGTSAALDHGPLHQRAALRGSVARTAGQGARLLCKHAASKPAPGGSACRAAFGRVALPV